jgi:hypothetical protein
MKTIIIKGMSVEKNNFLLKISTFSKVKVVDIKIIIDKIAENLSQLTGLSW